MTFEGASSTVSYRWKEGGQQFQTNGNPAPHVFVVLGVINLFGVSYSQTSNLGLYFEKFYHVRLLVLAH